MTGTNHILRVDCPDRPGILAAVANALSDAECNIEDAAQFNDKLSGRFFVRIVFSPVKDRTAIENFKTAFTVLARTFDMTWNVHQEEEKVRTLLMVSKADHCLNDILYRWRTGHLPIDITAVVSNHETCRELVENNGLRFEYLPVTKETRTNQERALSEIIDQTNTELVVLARYMQILSENICTRYAGRVINIHHSFLPGFKGARPYHQAWERGVKIIGATAHFATADLDEGPIIEQETARIDHAHTPEKLQILGQDIEAKVLSRAMLDYTERRIFLHGHRTVVL
ncbi:MAG: formyltetrahydrofolate deformylase [Rhodospirillales bacterium]|nr:formyltetrahydrofolate deformylase [Rhodospirillales bacterium]